MDFENLNSESFDPSKFIKKVLEGATGGSGTSGGDDLRKLRQLRSRVHNLAEESSQSIKKNVFQNYKQFIETAKEISYLESEMYDLSHLLTEQKTLIEQMSEMTFGGPGKSPAISGAGRSTGMSKEVERRKSMQALLDKVDGAGHLSENPNRYLVYDSDLTELNTENGIPLRNLHLFLLNDSLVLATWVARRHKFQMMFPLDNLAIVNVKDTEELKNAFKLLVFPDQKLFSAENARIKRQWLDNIELAKQEMLNQGCLVRQATIRTKKKVQIGNSPANVGSTNPFEEYGDNRERVESSGEVEWLRELPDEMDVCIAQRDFDAAAELLFEGREQLNNVNPMIPIYTEVKEKLLEKERFLVEVLGKELKTDKSAQGGFKAGRKAISLLIRLGRSPQACDLYLKHRSAQLKRALKEVRIADDPMVYSRNLSRLVFAGMVEAIREFTKLFPDDAGCSSVLVLWASGEMDHYINQILKNVFEPNPALAVLGQTVKTIYQNCQQLADLGLDLSFEVDRLLGDATEKAIDLNFSNALEALKNRNQEDRWNVTDFSSEVSFNRFLEEISSLGLNVDYLTEQVPGSNIPIIQLSPGACHFIRTVVTFSEDGGLLLAADLKGKICEWLRSLWLQEADHLDRAQTQEKSEDSKKALAHTTKFLFTTVMAHCEKIYTTSASAVPPGIRSAPPPMLQENITAAYPALKEFMHEEESFDV